MKTNIFVPSKINVGFQNRKDTYTGKLAYVVYFDEKNKLRKEASWQNWRDKDIPNEIYDNEPTEGFVLNKKVGGVEESWGWDARRTYTRVYDPRGFEFEITIPNLLWILECCNCIKGKGLEGEFVYGWDGKDLVLVPVESPDYKEIQEKNKVIHNNEFIKAKDLIVGATYETLKGDKYVYMGKFDEYKLESNYYYNYKSYRSIEEGWRYPLDETWFDDKIDGSDSKRYRWVNNGKRFFFVKLGSPEACYPYDKKDNIETFKSVTRKFSKVIQAECHEKYIEFVTNLLHKSSIYSPIDYTKYKILPLPYEVFEERMLNLIELYNSVDANYRYNKNITVGILKNNRLNCIQVYYGVSRENHENNNNIPDFYYYVRIPVGKNFYGQIQYKEQTKYFESIKELYESIKPMYGEQYLENGNLFRRYYYDTEE